MRNKILCLMLASCLALVSCEEKRPIVPPGSGTSTEGWTAVVPAPEAWDGTKRAEVSYQALVYSFADGPDADRTGDIAGLVSKLDYLDELGVSAIWLSPIHPCSSYHGYDVLDYAAVNPTFGTDADLQNLIDQAHSRDIKVYLDYVLNHSSNTHPWFLDAVSGGQDSPYWDYYAFSRDPQSDIAAGLIPQIATEGAAGYDSGQWYSTGSDAGASGRFHFLLDWTGTTPTVTVTQTDGAVDTPASGSASDSRYLYFGEGECLQFNQTSSGIYELTVDFESSWGFLVRTSSTSWEAGTKYGAASGEDIISFGEPFPLHRSTATFDPANIQFSAPMQYHSHFWTGAFADFNYGPASSCENSAAFTALTEAADKWVRMGVDGFRLDAVKHIYHNATSSENPTFLGKFYDRMNATYKAAGGDGDFYMVGEMLSEAAEVAPYYSGLPALFEFSFWYRLEWALNNSTGCYFAKDIMGYRDLYASYRDGYIAATKLSNHDENRTGSALNRNTAAMKQAAAVLLTADGEPYIYQGEELGYWGTKDGGDEYVRTPILWDRSGGDLADGALSGKVDKSMLTSEISVEAQSADENSILNVYRDFSKVRNTYNSLADGKMQRHPILNEDNASFPSIAAWYMVSGSDRALVVHNFGTTQVVITGLDDDLSSPVAVLGTVMVRDAGELSLGANSSVVFEL